MLEYLDKYDKGQNENVFNIGDDFSLQKELQETINIIEGTLQKERVVSKMKQLPYPVEKVNHEELENYVIKENMLYILEVDKEDVKYEYLINRKFDNDKLIVFHNGTVADNSQLILSNWIVKPALDSVIFYCFDNITDSLNHIERFDVIDAFKKHEYVPKIYLHVNMCSEADNSKQLVPFLQEFEKIRGIKNYKDIEVILHYEETKGYDGLNKDDALGFIYSILGL